MTISRRSFVTESALLGLLPAFLAHPELVEARSTTAVIKSRIAKPTAGETYWSNLYASPEQRSRGEFSGTPKPDRDVRFLHFDDKSGLRWAEDIKLQELPSFSEDAVVTLELGGFRAGTLDTSKLSRVKFAQLHISCQRITALDFFGPLAWATIATIFADKAKKLPTVTDLSSLTEQMPSDPVSAKSAVSPAAPAKPAVNRVLLSKGAGQMSVNVTTTPPTSFLDKFLSATVEATKILAPLLSFPAISLPALQAFYAFYGKLEQALPSNFLLNTAQKDVIVTQQGTDNNSVSVNALKLMTGTFFLIPKAHENDFATGMERAACRCGRVSGPEGRPSQHAFRCPCSLGGSKCKLCLAECESAALKRGHEVGINTLKANCASLSEEMEEH
jgi:hypothetical protein